MPYVRHSINSLRLNIEAAEAGQTWLLLPEEYRTKEGGETYPLPGHQHELQRLIAIHLSPSYCGGNQDMGDVVTGTDIYIKRAIEKVRDGRWRRQSAVLDAGRRQKTIVEMQSKLKAQMNALKVEAAQAVEEVKERAQEAIASLNDLFALGRQAIDGQLRAHLDGTEWQGERISAQAARQCFRMVSMAVKGLGLPSEQRQSATQSVMDQIAESLKQTQDALVSGPGEEDETAH